MMENTIKMDDFGGTDPYFRKPPYIVLQLGHVSDNFE